MWWKDSRTMMEKRKNLKWPELYGKPSIVGIAKAQRIKWLGHE